MIHERESGSVDADQIAEVIREGLPAAPGGMSEEEFGQLSENIARAIALAARIHEEQLHSPKPEFGEEHRQP